MKRFYIACALLALVLVLNILSYIALDRTTASMEALLLQARVECADERYADAVRSIDALERQFAHSRPLLLLLVRRDLFYEIDLTNASLRAYANEASQCDFDAEAERALRRIEVLRHTMLQFG
ncbi:MAG: DUF4363 family protein [Oscillospiraceae bacterium]|nr:DUF4363 family protein [Oscillospiraceae bacterium]